jgi:hypothetical protein
MASTANNAQHVSINMSRFLTKIIFCNTMKQIIPKTGCLCSQCLQCQQYQEGAVITANGRTISNTDSLWSLTILQILIHHTTNNTVLGYSHCMTSISNLSMQLALTEAERTGNKLYIPSALCFTFLTQIHIAN